MSQKAASLLRENKSRLIDGLIRGHSQPRTNRFNDPPEVLKERVGEGLNLLIGHLEGRPNFDALYTGQRMTELVYPELSYQDNLRACRAAVDDEAEVLRKNLAPLLDEKELARFEDCYRSATLGLTTEAKRHVRTLFIGDCFLSEIAAFLLGPLAAEGISIDPFSINPRSHSDLKTLLDSLSSQQYDVIFFSPFTHARVAEIEALLSPANCLMPTATLKANVSAVINQTKSILNYLTSRFECPIFVHNASLVHRFNNSLKASAVSLTSSRVTSLARRQLNTWLSGFADAHNGDNFSQLFIIDEDAIARARGRISSGRYVYASPWQHATQLSQSLATEYLSIICSIAHLVGKKLVICDLDNTIWDGVIGEGEVVHFEDRQQALKSLKDFGGVVLSIASKNDPAKVHFTNGVLTADDFVAPQISWDLKPEAIGKIKRTLNLQTKHMIFLDDRADERSLVQEAYPDLTVMDPCNPETWKQIRTWSDLVRGSSDLDRTKMYQEQSKRDAAIDTSDHDEHNRVEALKTLKLRFSIRRAAKGDLKRVAELINRTNQWNLNASRTSFEQVRGWHEASDTRILIANAADKFGDMGGVCVAVTKLNDENAEILAFVLSCRVFGYGVETAILKEIARISEIGTQRTFLVGQYRATNQNQPCRTMYPDHGFVENGASFHWNGSPAIVDPPWATVSTAMTS
jgi:FkbH-like protein